MIGGNDRVEERVGEIDTRPTIVAATTNATHNELGDQIYR